MKPYFEEDGIAIYHGDCREILPLVKADSIVTDPPYGETSLDWDRQVRGWMTLAACASNSLWCFGSLQMFMDLACLGEIGEWQRSQEIVWEKHNGSSFHADRFKRVHELSVHFYRGLWSDIYKSPVTTADATARAVRRKTRPAHTGHIEASSYLSHDGGPRLMRSVIYVRSCHGYAAHPTQKPLGILEPLLEYSVPIGGVVCDPFCGSGSTLVAAKSRGLCGIGIDVDERWCEIAAKRLAQGVLSL